jgi:hypothetical protein
MGILVSIPRNGQLEAEEANIQLDHNTMLVCAVCKAPNRSTREACFNCGTDLRLPNNVAEQIQLHRSRL